MQADASPMLAGKCLCGAVRYAVEGPFLYASYCHCSRCRAASGSAFSAFAGIESDKLRVTDGEDSIALFERGPDNSRCKLCGSPLFALVRDGQYFHVRMGTLVDDPGIRPTFHIFVGSKAPWHEITDSLPQYAELPPAEARRPDDPAIAPAPQASTTEEEMTLEMTRTDEKAQIRGLLDDWAKAARAGDIEGIMAAYAPDILSFDAIAQLQFKGAEAYRKHWEMCVEMCSGPMTFEIHDLGIEAGDGVAFAHYLLKCGGTGPDGKEQSGWMRVTVCCRRTSGRWKVAHEHFSVPFDMESGKALLGLEP